MLLINALQHYFIFAKIANTSPRAHWGAFLPISKKQLRADLTQGWAKEGRNWRQENVWENVSKLHRSLSLGSYLLAIVLDSQLMQAPRNNVRINAAAWRGRIIRFNWNVVQHFSTLMEFELETHGFWGNFSTSELLEQLMKLRHDICRSQRVPFIFSYLGCPLAWFQCEYHMHRLSVKIKSVYSQYDRIYFS